MPLDLSAFPEGAPLVMGIAGGTGSGKTTIAESVSKNQAGIVLLKQDAYYKHRNDLSFEERTQLNYDHPDSIEVDLLVSHIRKLRLGRPVNMPEYDFNAHLRSGATHRLISQPVIIVEGILVLALATVRECLDLKIFIDTDADLRLMRRIRRDIEQRGREVESVLEQYAKTVRPMHLEFVEPSKNVADVIIPGGFNPKATGLITALIRARTASDELTIA